MNRLALPLLFAAMTGCAPATEPESSLERGVPTGLTAADVARVESGIKANLKDPESARFGSMAAARLSSGAIFVCGYVNAKNSFGGYTGEQLFNGLLPPDFPFMPIKIASSDIDNQVVRKICADSGVAV